MTHCSTSKTGPVQGPTPDQPPLSGRGEVVSGSLLYHPIMTYGLFGKFTAPAGNRDELVGHLLQAAKLLERNAACIHYAVGTTEEPEGVWVWEAWTDKAAHDASVDDEDVRELIQKARPLIAGISHQTELTIHGGKGVDG